MVLFFANASFTINRVAPVPGSPGTSAPQIVAQNVPARIEFTGGDLSISKAGRALDIDYQISMEVEVDVRVGDRLTGYNPRKLTTPPVLIVQRVNVNDGSFLRHLEIWAEETRDPGLA